MRNEIPVSEMLDFLSEKWEYSHGLVKDFGADDPRAEHNVMQCIGMKEMIECLAGFPVGLGMDGVLRVGREAL